MRARKLSASDGFAPDSLTRRFTLDPAGYKAMSSPELNFWIRLWPHATSSCIRNKGVDPGKNQGCPLLLLLSLPFFPFPFFPFPSLPSQFHYSPLPFLSIPLPHFRCRPLKYNWGLGKRCKLLQWDLGRSPNRNGIWYILALKSHVCWQQF